MGFISLVLFGVGIVGIGYLVLSLNKPDIPPAITGLIVAGCFVGAYLTRKMKR